MLKPGAFLDVALQRDNLDIEIGDVVVSSSAPFAGKTIRESGFRESTGATILAIKRANEKIVGNPSPDMVILPGDEMVIMGTLDQIAEAERLSELPD